MAARPPRLGRGLGIAHLGIVRHVGGGRVHGLLRALARVLGRDLGVLHGHALGVVGLGRLAVLPGFVLAAILAAVLVLVLGIAAAFVAHVERVEQVVDGIAEAPLVFEQPFEAIEAAPGAILDERTPELDELPGCGRRRLAGQTLAHQHRDRILDRRIGAVGDLVELAAVEAVVEHGREILRHAVHAAGADRLDPRLLDGVEHRARLLSARSQAAMHGRIMAGELERDRIGMAAHDRGILPAELARRLRQPHLLAGEPRPLGGKRDLEVRLPGDRAQATRDRALERLGRAFLRRGLALGVRGH